MVLPHVFDVAARIAELAATLDLEGNADPFGTAAKTYMHGGKANDKTATMVQNALKVLNGGVGAQSLKAPRRVTKAQKCGSLVSDPSPTNIN